MIYRETLLRQNRVNDIKQSFVWDYKSLYPIAIVNNANENEDSLLHTSFEADGQNAIQYKRLH